METAIKKDGDYVERHTVVHIPHDEEKRMTAPFGFVPSIIICIIHFLCFLAFIWLDFHAYNYYGYLTRARDSSTKMSFTLMESIVDVKHVSQVLIRKLNGKQIIAGLEEYNALQTLLMKDCNSFKQKGEIFRQYLITAEKLSGDVEFFMFYELFSECFFFGSLFFGAFLGIIVVIFKNKHSEILSDLWINIAWFSCICFCLISSLVFQSVFFGFNATIATFFGLCMIVIYFNFIAIQRMKHDNLDINSRSTVVQSHQ